MGEKRVEKEIRCIYKWKKGEPVKGGFRKRKQICETEMELKKKWRKIKPKTENVKEKYKTER